MANDEENHKSAFPVLKKLGECLFIESLHTLNLKVNFNPYYQKRKNAAGLLEKERGMMITFTVLILYKTESSAICSKKIFSNYDIKIFSSILAC